jgi:endonuclease-3
MAVQTEKSPSQLDATKRPFRIGTVLARIRKAVRPYPKAALFELAEAGYDSVFELLIACIISTRTRDETTVPISRRFFAVARTPAAVSRLAVEEIDRLIAASTFHEPKARWIHTLAQRAAADFGGVLPADADVLQTFPGVGPKCANLVVGIVGGPPCISVDIHVHRVTIRWGYVQAKTPEQSLQQLVQRLPRRWWVEINALLVPFGKHICTGISPRCSTCPVLDMCLQVGVTTHR